MVGRRLGRGDRSRSGQFGPGARREMGDGKVGGWEEEVLEGLEEGWGGVGEGFGGQFDASFLACPFHFEDIFC